jgi:hypothetical protein
VSGGRADVCDEARRAAQRELEQLRSELGADYRPRLMPDGTPAPGSLEAQAEGCVCARWDNRRGLGYRPATNANPNPVWVITKGCPVHAWDEESPPH